MISLKTSIKHLAWSNQKFFGYFVDMPEEVFTYRAADGEWPVSKLLSHIAGSEEWFRYCLTGMEGSELKSVTNGSIVREYLLIMANLDAVLLSEASKPDEVLEIEDESGIFHAKRSLILSQAVMHAAEHKGQIATILKQNHIHVDLDALDVWSFVAESNQQEDSAS